MNMFSNPGNPLAALGSVPLKQFSADLTALGGGLATVRSNFKLVADAALGAARTFADSLVPAVLSPVQSLRSLGEAIAPLVGAFNPAALEQFNLAVQDLLAVLGEGLSPVMEAVTQGVREFADMLLNSSVPQQLGEILASLVEAAQPLVVALFRIVEAVMPMVKVLVEVLKPAFDLIAGALGMLLEVFKFFRQAVYNVLRKIMDWVPDGKERWEKRDFSAEEEVERKARERLGAESSQGKAVRDVAISDGGSALDAFRKRVSTSALKVGSGDDKTQKQIDLAKAQLDVLNDMRDKQGRLSDALENMYDRISLEQRGLKGSELDETVRQRARARERHQGRSDEEVKNRMWMDPYAKAEMERRKERQQPAGDATPSGGSAGGSSGGGAENSQVGRMIQGMLEAARLARV